jgi:hypothetical protein
MRDSIIHFLQQNKRTTACGRKAKSTKTDTRDPKKVTCRTCLRAMAAWYSHNPAPGGVMPGKHKGGIKTSAGKSGTEKAVQQTMKHGSKKAGQTASAGAKSSKQKK